MASRCHTRDSLCEVAFIRVRVYKKAATRTVAKAIKATIIEVEDAGEAVVGALAATGEEGAAEADGAVVLLDELVGVTEADGADGADPDVGAVELPEAESGAATGVATGAATGAAMGAATGVATGAARGAEAGAEIGAATGAPTGAATGEKTTGAVKLVLAVKETLKWPFASAS